MSQFKAAQRRSWFDKKIRQNLDVSTRALSLFNSQFNELFTFLQQTDDEARELAMGLAPFKKRAEGQFSEKNYLGCAEQVGRFYDTAGEINKSLSKINTTLEEKNYSILVEHLDEDVKQYLADQSKNAVLQLVQFTKTAGLFDWLKDSLSTRYRAISMMEKKFSRFKELRVGLEKEVRMLEVLHSNILKIFKKMSTAIAKGDISEYERNIKLYSDMFTIHNNRFRAFFNKDVKPFANYIKDQLEKTKAKAISVPKPAPEAPKQNQYLNLPENHTSEVPEAPEDEEEESLLNIPVNQNAHAAPMGSYLSAPTQTFTTPSSPQSAIETAPMGSYLSAPNQTFTPAMMEARLKAKKLAPTKAPIKSKVEPKINTLQKETVQEQPKASDVETHAAFLDKISLMKNSSIPKLVNEILAYSESIEDTDLDASLRLLSIVEGVIEG